MQDTAQDLRPVTEAALELAAGRRDGESYAAAAGRAAATLTELVRAVRALAGEGPAARLYEDLLVEEAEALAACRTDTDAAQLLAARHEDPAVKAAQLGMSGECAWAGWYGCAQAALRGLVYLAESLQPRRQAAGLDTREVLVEAGAIGNAVIHPDETADVVTGDGRRLCFGPATTETGEAADGWDCARYEQTEDEDGRPYWRELGYVYAASDAEMTALAAGYA